MAEYCGNCAHCDTNGASCFGEYYCEIKQKYVSKNASACSSYIKKPDKGYQRAGCYITTMVCNMLGYEDNCEILNTLRNLRESYLKHNEEGIRLLHEYDQIGPIISNLIQKESIEYITVIFDYFINPCAKFTSANLYPQATLIYQTMFEELKARYGLLDLQVNYNANTPMDLLGKGRIRTKLKKDE